MQRHNKADAVLRHSNTLLQAIRICRAGKTPAELFTLNQPKSYRVRFKILCKKPHFKHAFFKSTGGARCHARHARRGLRLLTFERRKIKFARFLTQLALVSKIEPSKTRSLPCSLMTINSRASTVKHWLAFFVCYPVFCVQNTSTELF